LKNDIWHLAARLLELSLVWPFSKLTLIRKGWCNAAFVHLPSGKITQLNEDQILAFLKFCAQESSSHINEEVPPPIPFQISPTAFTLNVTEAIEQNVYREKGQLSTPRRILEQLDARCGTGKLQENESDLAA
jgi:hypothetical protein